MAFRKGAGAKDDQPELDFAAADADAEAEVLSAPAPAKKARKSAKSKKGKLFPTPDEPVSTKPDLRSATEMYEQLRNGALRDLRVGLLHGRLDSFFDRQRHLAGLTGTKTHVARFVADNNQGGERQILSALHDLGDSIDRNDLIFKVKSLGHYSVLRLFHRSSFVCVCVCVCVCRERRLYVTDIRKRRLLQRAQPRDQHADRYHRLI